ncbi:MAG: lycopene cyclase domain-containing protein [Flammeovirgaceae bacterium]
MTLYFQLLLFTISFPLLASWDKRFNYASKFKYLFPSIFITATFFIIWDVIFTKNGVWGFSDVHTSNINLLYLPIEEWLFFIIIPFSCVFIYESVKYFFRLEKYENLSRNILMGIGVILVITSLFNLDRSYTFWNFLFCGLFLLYSTFKRRGYHANFIVSYLFHLIPFLIVNGILTDGNFDFNFSTDPVVWYNNNENLFIRFITIPVEDFFYSMLLLLMNVTFYEKFKS